MEYRKNMEGKNPKVARAKCAVCDNEISKFIEQQEASGLLSSLGIKMPLSKIPLVGSPLF